MTRDADNRTTELREKLDALGIEHFDFDKGGRKQTQWEAPDGKRHFTYETSDNPAKTARLVIAWHPTPEQAIAATVGEQRSTVEIAELLDEFEHECYMLRVEASETRARDDVVRESYERIRDEFAGRIAATVGNGTCELVTSEHDYDSLYYHAFSCGHDIETDNEAPPIYCPECGAKVVKR